MIDFAVWHEGLEEGKGRWVLHVDTAGDRLLLVEDDGTLYWRPFADCKAIRFATPDQPRPVIPVTLQPQNGAGIVTPATLPRADRRNGMFGRN